MSQKILLRSVYGKVGQIYTINPCPNDNGQFCKWVRRIDSQGNMILSDADKNESVVEMHDKTQTQKSPFGYSVADGEFGIDYGTDPTMINMGKKEVKSY